MNMMRNGNIIICIALGFLAFAEFVVIVTPLPYMMLQTSRPKCIKVNAPPGATLVVNYHFPDMIIIDDDGSIDHSKLAKLKLDSEERKRSLSQNSDLDMKTMKGNKDNERDGKKVDNRDKERDSRKVENMRRMLDGMKDMSITITQKQLDTVRLERERRRFSNFNDIQSRMGKGTGRFHSELSEREGTIEYTTSQEDGLVEICVQSMSATHHRPSRIALKVDEKIDNTGSVSSDREDKLSEKKVEKHLTRFEGELLGLRRKIEMLLVKADSVKEQEIDFHQQSIEMNNASRYWPMLHVFIVLITGFTTGNHILRFFKAHHIC